MNNPIWILQRHMPYRIDRATVADNVQFPNLLDVTAQLGRGSGGQASMSRDRWQPAKPLKVEVDVPEFALDFWKLSAGLLVSARLRKAWAAASAAVEYVAIDAGGSCAEARAKDYRLMHVLAEEPVIDLARSDYDTADELEWLPKGFPYYAKSFVLHEDADPNHPIFRDAIARNRVFCTDAFAVSALAASCTGIRFVDPQTLRLLRPIRYRTLEGIAESGDYDPVSRKEHAQLVKKIPAVQ